jgi:casein kinase 1
LENKHPQLAYETKILKSLQGGIGIPNVYYYYNESKYNYMIIDLLSSSLELLFTQCNKSFTLKTIIMLSEQMVIM